MRPDLLVRRAWFFFRMGNMYLSFPLGFFGTLIVMYELALKEIPFFRVLHLWGFSLVFGIPYVLLGVYVGVLHVKHQSLTEAILTAPFSPYEYKMKPFGKEARLGMPSQLTSYKAAIRMYEWMDAVSKRLNIEIPPFEEFIPETERYKKMTETLLEGGEVR